MNITGIDDDVAPHVQQSAHSPNSFSPPVSLTIRLPETMPLETGQTGGEGSLRGTPLNLTIAGPDQATVGELMSAMLEEAAGMGLRPFPRPGFEAFGGAPEFVAKDAEGEDEEEKGEVEDEGEGGEVAVATEEGISVGMRLTSVLNHRIVQVDTPPPPLAAPWRQ